MSVQSQIDRISGEVNGQKNLIAQLSTILAGKVGGVVPAGTVTLSVNGIHDVAQYDSAFVSIPALPSGIIALNTGVVQLNLDVGAAAIVPHGLSVAPNFYALYAEPDFNADEISNVVVSAFVIQQNITADGEQLPCSATTVRLDSSGYFTADMVGSQPGTYFNDERILIYGPMVSSIKYRWIAARIDYS